MGLWITGIRLLPTRGRAPKALILTLVIAGARGVQLLLDLVEFGDETHLRDQAMVICVLVRLRPQGRRRSGRLASTAGDGPHR